VLDLHNHVLFGLDDGCRHLEESDVLAERARALGHEGFVATPHIRPGMFDNTVEGIRRRRDETEAVVRRHGLELFLGAEYYFCGELLAAARARTLLTLGETSRFVLCEFPQGPLPVRFADVLYELRLAGYVPVIAHPERSAGVAQDVDAALEAFAHAEVLLQLDLGSLIGRYGRSAERTSVELVKRGAYHVAAGDLHRPEDAALLAPAKKVLQGLLDKRRRGADLDVLLRHNPRRIVTDQPLDAIVPV
jgi:protein-tyrosine phosphatase